MGVFPGYMVSQWSQIPASALAITILCCYQWSPLNPSPLSHPLPVKSQIPGGCFVWGHWDTLFDCNLLELLSKPRVMGVSACSLPAQGVHSSLDHSGQSSQPGGRGFWQGFTETCFLWSETWVFLTTLGGREIMQLGFRWRWVRLDSTGPLLL